jgi:hypothetical protein
MTKKVLAAAALVVSMACSRGGVSAAPTPAEPCTGLRNLLVNNGTSSSVDVYAVDGNANLLGTVGPGRTELPIPVTVTTSRFRAVIRGPLVGNTSARRLISRVSYQITCRGSQQSF